MSALRKALAWYLHALIFVLIYTLLSYCLPEQWLLNIFESLQDDAVRNYRWSEIYGPGLLTATWALSLFAFFIPPKRLIASLTNIAAWHIYTYAWLMIGRLGVMYMPDEWAGPILRDTPVDQFGADDIPGLAYLLLTLVLNGVLIWISLFSLEGVKRLLAKNN